MYILNDGVSCAEGYFRCSEEGILSSFNETGCLGAENAYQLSIQSISIVDGFSLGSVEAHLNEISGGTAEIEWTAIAPISYLIPVNEIFLEIISTILMSLSILLGLPSLLHWGLEFRKSKTTHRLLMLISQSLFCAFLVGKMVYVYTIYEGGDKLYNNIQMWVTETTLYIMDILSTMLCSFATVNFLHIILNWSQKRLLSIRIIISMIYFVFCGGIILNYIMQVLVMVFHIELNQLYTYMKIYWRGGFRLTVSEYPFSLFGI
jgi:hypothetical protein